MARTCRPALFATALVLAATPAAAARDALGVFGGWGAFRDPARCFAIAEPLRRSSAGAPWRAFAAITHWPANGIRNQLHVRLRLAKLRGAPVTLSIGDRRFALASGGADAWAPDARADAAIVAALRSGSSMSIETVDTENRPFADVYRLRGAATAIDATALACARRG